MNFKDENEKLKALLSNDDEQVLEACKSVLPSIKIFHRDFDEKLFNDPIVQCILECYKIKNKFNSSYWKKADLVLDSKDQKPTKFKLNNIQTELFNASQIEDENLENLCDFELKDAILNCVNEFPSTYGRGGIAKILNGSSGLLKGGDFNLPALNSKYYGLFEEFSQKYIINEIDELIKDGYLKIVKKGSYARPFLDVAEKTKFELEKNKNSFNKKEIQIQQNDDENLVKILNSVKEGKNLFITGHAGSGKSYILKKLKERLKKRLTITSTTGIAAVNVKGQTLHSWAGVGICAKPVDVVVEKILKNKTTKNQIQKCEILAVDEISMLDIKTFEYVDAVLRQVRENSSPFGGLQLIFIGDFFQLPPVEKEASDKKFCFESSLWEELNLQAVILTKNYRQNEESLINALKNMRINALTKEDIDLFLTRQCIEDKVTSDILHIFATNEEADNYNLLKFKNVNSKEYSLMALDGVYRGNNFSLTAENPKEENILKRIDMVCNAEKNISLKVGARVMLLINLDFNSGLINGSCGNVLEINYDDDYVLVQFDNGVKEKIERHDFEFYNNEILIAKRSQFPLRLAYGITIHKSQGMSLDKLVVDCARIFEKGQAYVALSRIKTLEGLYLNNFDPKKVMVDEKVVEFYNKLENSAV